MSKKKTGPAIILALFIITCFSWSIGKGYKNDSIPFKKQLVTLNNAIDLFLFRVSPNEEVILGKENWLYYHWAGGDSSLEGEVEPSPFSHEELAAIAENCVKQKEFLEVQGKEFVIVIAPDKERIYYENLPSKYSSVTKADRGLQCVKYLRENTDVRVVYPYEELLWVKGQLKEDLYYRTDSHWNPIGAYIGSRELLQELGIRMPELGSECLTISKEEYRAGDLTYMLGVEQMLEKFDVEYRVKGYDTHSSKMLEGNLRDTIRYQAEGADPRKLYMVRDSFASNMADYIGSQFNSSYLKYKEAYSYEDFLKKDPDIFVYETVERDLEELVNFSVQDAGR